MRMPGGAFPASGSSGVVAEARGLEAMGLAIVGFALYSVADAAMKVVASHVPIAQAIAVSCATSLLPVLLLAVTRGGGWSALRVKRWSVHVARAFAGAGAMCCNIYAFAHMPLADAYAILFSGPLVQSAASAVLLGETMRWRDWAIVSLGFCGVLVMLKPDMAGIDVPALSAVAGVLFFSASSLIVRRFGGTETRFTFPFYGNLLIFVLVSPVALIGFVPPGADVLLLNGAVGIVTGLAMMAVLGAFQVAAITRVAPFQYSQLVWAVLLGWTIFGDMPTLRLGVGASLVIASGALLIRREVRAAPAPAKSAHPTSSGIQQSSTGEK